MKIHYSSIALLVLTTLFISNNSSGMTIPKGALKQAEKATERRNDFKKELNALKKLSDWQKADQIQKLLEKYVKDARYVLTVQDDNGKTILHWAAEADIPGNIYMFMYEKGVSPSLYLDLISLKDKKGASPFTRFIDTDDKFSVEQLLGNILLFAGAASNEAKKEIGSKVAALIKSKGGLLELAQKARATEVKKYLEEKLQEAERFANVKIHMMAKK